MALKSQVKTNFCAIEVRKEKYPESNSKDAMEKGNVATTQLGKGNKNKLAIFRYNAGKAKKILPPNHPYRATRCTGNGKIDMTGLMGYPAVFLSAESEKCKASKLIERMDKERISKVLKTKTINQMSKELNEITKEIGRYHIDFGWKGYRSGHIISLERLENGLVKIYDPQNGKIVRWSELSKKISLRYGVNVLRVDNLLINTDIIDGIVSKL